MIEPKIPGGRRESAKSAKGEQRANGQVPMGMDQFSRQVPLRVVAKALSQ
jgi:hypothetical protein